MSKSTKELRDRSWRIFKGKERLFGFVQAKVHEVVKGEDGCTKESEWCGRGGPRGRGRANAAPRQSSFDDNSNHPCHPSFTSDFLVSIQRMSLGKKNSESTLISRLCDGPRDGFRKEAARVDTAEERHMKEAFARPAVHPRMAEIVFVSVLEEPGSLLSSGSVSGSLSLDDCSSLDELMAWRLLVVLATAMVDWASSSVCLPLMSLDGGCAGRG